MRALLIPIALLGGCDLFNKAADAINGVIDPVVAVGVIAVVDTPQVISDRVTLPEEYQAGVSAEMFLADARSVSDLANAPIAGADVTMGGCGDTVTLADGGNGSYSTAAQLPGCDGPTFTVRRADVDPNSVLPVTIPAEQDAGIPSHVDAGADLTLDLSNADWSGAVLVVLDATDGSVVWTSKPTDVTGWYQLLKGQMDLSAVTIPGASFAADSEYAVVVTGLQRTTGADLEEVNTVLSTVAGGRGAVYLTTTRTLP